MIGAGFVADLHLSAFARTSNAVVRAVAGRSLDSAATLASRHEITDAYGDYRSLLERDDIDLVCVGTPNDTHRDIVVMAAQAGKHVICEKPLARTLVEADEMIAATHQAGVKLMYAELLCFAPKYVRAKELVDEGAFGRVFQVRHTEQHSGPHADWFWQGERSGGGVMMDMGCHGVELLRWMYDKAQVESVTAVLGTFVHGTRTELDDHAVVVVGLEDDRLGVIETSWAKLGGMDDRVEITGDRGVTYVDLLRGSAMAAYSEAGYGYAVEKASQTNGWTFPMVDEPGLRDPPGNGALRRLRGERHRGDRDRSRRACRTRGRLRRLPVCRQRRAGAPAARALRSRCRQIAVPAVARPRHRHSTVRRAAGIAGGRAAGRIAGSTAGSALASAHRHHSLGEDQALAPRNR